MSDLQEYRSWCEARGCVLHNIDAGYVAEGWRGIVATAHIPAGGLLLTVPERLLMSVASARRDPALAAALAALLAPGLPSFSILAVHLIAEVSKGQESEWAGYLKHLPRSHTTLACFTEAEAQELQVPEAQQAAAAALERCRQQWREARPLMQQLGLPAKWQSLKAWLWSFATLTSRTMFVPWDSAGALTPFGDLHNYQPPPQGFLPDVMAPPGGSPTEDEGSSEAICGDGRYDPQRHEYCLVARREFQPGEQVFLCYGKHSNLELLELYGFTMGHTVNPHDRAPLPLETLKTMAGPALDLREAECWVHAGGQPSWHLLATLRLAAASATERKAAGHRALAGDRISPAGDLKVVNWIKEACFARLATLPTTLKADQELLAACGKSPADTSSEAHRAALQWRITYKMTLRAAVLRAEACSAELKALIADAGCSTKK